MRHIISLTALLCVFTAVSARAASTQAADPQLKVLPTPLEWRNTAVDWKVDNGETLSLTAGAKTDWFVWPGGGYSADSSPRLLFRAGDDFSFSAKVTVEAGVKYDAGCLVLADTDTNWAKLCLEAQEGGHLSVISVVTKTLSDDATSRPETGNSVYLKISRSGDVVFLYASVDSREWEILRKFNFATSGDLKAGFSAQSPDGTGASARFTDLRYLSGDVDLWKLK